MSRAPVPERVTLRLYQAGFGEVQLLSFLYGDPLDDGRNERHVLIDFGSTHSPKGAQANLLVQAAELVREHTSGRLDAIVVTHRHKDHISGFGIKQAADVIASLQPRLVVRPWTEDPALPRDATAPLGAGDGDGDARSRFGMRLAAGQQLAAQIESLVKGARTDSTRGKLAQAASDQLPNARAIRFLDELAERTAGEYLHAGQSTQLEQVVPGITVRVLGPPTIEEAPDIVKQRATDPDEFWMLQLKAIEVLTPDRLDTRVPKRPEGVPPGPVAWLVDRLARQQIGALMRLVRTVDDALNNTSLILLIDAGDRRLLLPGDAQIENWSWALTNAPNTDELRALLADVDLYKVGHHGSRNATPRSLFRLWTEEAADPQRPMCALMSTMADVHGDTEATAVPRATLVEALTGRMQVFGRTDKLQNDVPFTAVEAPTSGKVPFSALTD